MPRRLKLATYALGPWLVLAFGVAPAYATFDTSVTTTVTQAPGNIFTYTYSVNDLATSTSSVSEFDVNVATTANLTSITNPAGFLALYTAGDSFISFLSTDPSFDIMAGASGIFSFVSLTGAGPQADLVRGFNDTSTNGSGVVQNVGTALAPVPEPTSLALLSLGALSLAGIHLRGRVRTPVS